MSKKRKVDPFAKPWAATQPTPAQIERAISLCYEGKALFHSGQLPAAIEKFRQAISLVPQIKNAHYMLAECYWRSGKTQKAIAAAEAELLYHPDNPNAKDLLTGLRSAPDGPRLTVAYFEEQGPPSSWPSVSLCMIVKNEEANLADCLSSVKDLVSEIIIVDTGSTDRTVEIARAFGARVEHFTWINDFAAARNESIKYATCDWILWLDADDRVSPQAIVQLKRALVSGIADAYDCLVVSPLAHGGRSSLITTNHIRLFRNHLGLRFDDAIHESIYSSLMRQGRTLAYTNITIEHVGYAVSQQAIQEKARRNEAILLTRLERDPGNLMWRYHLGVGKYIQEDWAGAIEQLEMVVADPPYVMHKDRDLYQAHALIASAYTCLNQYEAAQQAFERAAALFPERRHLWITTGIFHLQAGQPELAVRDLERARTLSPDSDRYGNAWAPGKLEETLGQAYLLLDNASAARQAYLDKLAAIQASRAPIQPETWQRARDLFDAGQFAQLIEELEPLAQADPAALRFLARAGVRSEQWERTCAWLQQAIALSEAQPREWADLGGYLMKAGRISYAERVGQLALSKARTPDERAAAHNLLGIIAVHRSEADQAVSHFVQALLADPSHQSAYTNLCSVSEQLGVAPWQAMRQEAQRLISQKAYAQAVAVLNLVFDHTRDDSQTFKLAALALMELGHEEEAFACWQTAQQLETNSSHLA